jgi:hypothetical protein
LIDRRTHIGHDPANSTNPRPCSTAAGYLVHCKRLAEWLNDDNDDDLPCIVSVSGRENGTGVGRRSRREEAQDVLAVVVVSIKAQLESDDFTPN